MGLFNDKQESVFNFGLDETSKAHLLETARWGKFLAIVSFVSFGLLLLIGVGLLFMTQLPDTMVTFLTYVTISLIYFYPIWALYKFSALSRQSINTQNQLLFNESLRYLKNMFKYMGIVTIIGFVLVGLMIVFGALGALIADA